MLSFEPKDAGDVLDYTQHLANLLADGLYFDSVEVEVESCDPPEDVFTLVVSNAQLVETNTPGTADTVLFWLTGGTVDTKYVLKTTFTDSQNTPLDRTFVRRSSIKIKPL